MRDAGDLVAAVEQDGLWGVDTELVHQQVLGELAGLVAKGVSPAYFGGFTRSGADTLS